MKLRRFASEPASALLSSDAIRAIWELLRELGRVKGEWPLRAGEQPSWCAGLRGDGKKGMLLEEPVRDILAVTALNSAPGDSGTWPFE